jgi:hypothetical protein
MTRSRGGAANMHTGLRDRSAREEARAWGLARLLEAGLDAREAWIEADLLLRHAAGLTREETLLHPSAPVADGAAEAYASLIARRAAGWPSATSRGGASSAACFSTWTRGC